MKRPAVFFDRDNTLIANNGYLGDPAGVVLIYGAADAVARVRALGFAAVTFSNQSGVARGKFPIDAVYAVNGRLDQLLKSNNPYAVIERHEFCPYHPYGTVEEYRKESDLRKPQPGMIFKAADELGLDLSRSWVVGDAPRDIEAGKAAGCRTILFNDHQLERSPAADEPFVEPDFRVASLYEAASVIENHRHPNVEPAPETTAVDPTLAAPSPSIAQESLPMPNVAENDQSPNPFLEPDATDPAPQGNRLESDRPAVEALSQDATAQAHMPADELVAALVNSASAGLKPAEPAAPTSAAPAAPPPRKMTFAERVRSGTFQPARAAVAPGMEPSKRIPPPKPPIAVVEEPAPPKSAIFQEPEPVMQAVTADDVEDEPAPRPTPTLAPRPAIPTAQKSTEPLSASETLEPLLQEILGELRRVRPSHPYPDFSVTKLLAGITQILALPALFFGYLYRDTPGDLQSALLLAVFLQVLTVTLLIMGKQQ